jgi:hypothetical protein
VLFAPVEVPVPRVPNADRAIIDQRKFLDYLLSPDSEDGAPKAKFLATFGYSKKNWRSLRRAVLEHLTSNDFATSRKTEYGRIFEVSGRLKTPDGRNPTVLIAWVIKRTENRPRLVSMVPD